MRWTSLASALLVAAATFLAAPDAAADCAPIARAVSPASGIVGTSVAATVTGSGLAGATTDVFGPAGLTVTVTTTSDTSVSLQITIDAAAAPGERIISLATAAGIAAVDFTVNPAGGPIVGTVSPVPVATQGFALALTIAGQNLGALTAANVAVSGNGVTVSNATALPDGTSLDLSLAVAADADIGTHAIVITSPLGGAVIGLYVQRPSPVVTVVSPAAGGVGTVVPLQITGTGLTGAALVVTGGASGNGGITITNVASPNDTTLTATLTLAGTLSAESAPRLLIVTTESGQATAEFSVVANGVPAITRISPAAGEPDSSTNVTIRGLGFTGATVSTPSASLTLQNATVVNDETITVDVVVAPGTNVDSLHTITVTRNLATSSATFQVIGDEKPFIGAVRPPFGNRGATFAIILEGVNLGTVVQGTGVVINGSKVSVTNATALDAFTVRAIVSLTDTAAAGYRDVIVTTDGGTFSKDQSFRVNIPGQVPTITNVTPTHVDPGTTTPITVTGAGLAGAGVTVGGAGATVSNIVADPLGATVTFDLTLTEDAPAESRPLLVVTENGIAQCNISSGADIQLVPAQLLQTGSEFRVTSIGFRLFLFEFSINSNFDQGLRTYGVANATGTLTISNLDALNVARAVRDLPFGYVRVLAVTATNQVGMSDVFRFRR